MRKPKYIGVFSRSSSGSLKGKKRKELFFAWEIDKNNYIVQAIDESFAPKAQPESATAKQLQNDFAYEAAILAAPVSTPDLSQLQTPQKKAAPAAIELTDKALSDLEKARKIKQLENDMRDNFSKALRSLNRQKDRKGALAALEQIIERREGITTAHKHMFRDFGVSLRKKSLLDLALRCAQRTLELAPNDDHAHFNLARILHSLKYHDQAAAHLQKAMKIDKEERIYQRFLSHLDQIDSQ